MEERTKVRLMKSGVEVVVEEITEIKSKMKNQLHNFIQNLCSSWHVDFGPLLISSIEKIFLVYGR